DSSFVLFIIRQCRRTTLFPYTTLFRSQKTMTVKTNPEEITENLRALFKDHFKKEVQEIMPLPVSGSDRRYYRMTAENISVIGTYNQNVSENNSYFYFTDLLTKHGINIPEIFIKSKDKRYYLQQDLGNKSLFARLIDR